MSAILFWPHYVNPSVAVTRMFLEKQCQCHACRCPGSLHQQVVCNRLGANQATSHYLNLWWLVYVSIGLNESRVSTIAIISLVDWGLMINSLWPNDSTWQHRCRLPLAQVMACCLTAPSHYLNQCWLVISEALWHPPEGNFPWSAHDVCLFLICIWK